MNSRPNGGDIGYSWTNFSAISFAFSIDRSREGSGSKLSSSQCAYRRGILALSRRRSARDNLTHSQRVTPSTPSRTSFRQPLPPQLAQICVVCELTRALYPNGMIIAGEWRRSSDGATTEIRNPATGEIVDRAATGTQQDIDNAIDAAQSAFRKWSSTPAALRAEIMSRGTRIVKEREKDLARLLTQEQGKPMREAVAEIRRFVKTMDYYA